MIGVLCDAGRADLYPSPFPLNVSFSLVTLASACDAIRPRRRAGHSFMVSGWALSLSRRDVVQNAHWSELGSTRIQNQRVGSSVVTNDSWESVESLLNTLLLDEKEIESPNPDKPLAETDDELALMPRNYRLTV